VLVITKMTVLPITIHLTQVHCQV